MEIFFKVTILSLVQAVAEFLPVSSSGHLVVFKHYLNFADAGQTIDIFLHLATLCSVLVFYRKTLLRIVINREWSYVGKIILSSVPAGVAGLFLYEKLNASISVVFIAFSFVFTGFVLFLNKIFLSGDKKLSTAAAIVMGFAQALALIPGVSRSGMTITAARLMKVEPAKSAEFSFLMSTIPIGGAALLDIYSCFLSPSYVNNVSWWLILYAMILAFVFGYFALRVLVKILGSGRFWMFAPYCIILGVFVLLTARVM